MNERERWIVYPLLFFALGAGLRDKFTQQVTTDRLHAGKIRCEELEIVDSEKPDRIVARLTSNAPQRGNPNADRYGVFILKDSEDKELCGVTNNQLHVAQIVSKNIISNQVAVVDPQNPSLGLGVLAAVEVPAPDGSTRRIGRLVLTDNKGQEVFGLADDQLVMSRIICDSLTVVNPENRQQTLAALGSGVAKPEIEGGKPERFGILVLNNNQFGSLIGNPPKRPLENQLPKAPSKPDEDESNQPAPEVEEPADETSPGAVEETPAEEPETT